MGCIIWRCGLSSPARYACLPLMSVPVSTLFENKSLHILWLSNLVRGNDRCRIETTHIQSQRARLRITLQQVIKNNSAPLETVPCLPSPWPLCLGCLFAGFSFCQLTLAGNGTLCIWQSLSLLLSSSSELPGFGQRLQGHFEAPPNIWAYSWEIGLL